MEAHNATIKVKHNGETIAVPQTMSHDDYAAYFGSVPDEFDVERVFVYDDNVHCEAHVGDGKWVEAIYQTEDSAPVFNASELGWVVQTLQADEPGDNHAEDAPGETLWSQE